MKKEKNQVKLSVFYEEQRKLTDAFRGDESGSDE